MYLKLQVTQSKFLRTIGNYRRRIPTSHLQDTLNIEPIPVIIHSLTAIFFVHCPSYPNTWPDKSGPTWPLCTRNINIRTEAHSAVISSPIIVVFWRKILLILFIYNFLSLVSLYINLFKFVRGKILFCVFEHSVHIFFLINLKTQTQFVSRLIYFAKTNIV
jgi:hypothetical protein